MRTLVSAIYHRDIQTVEYTADNGDRCYGTLAWIRGEPDQDRDRDGRTQPQTSGNER